MDAELELQFWQYPLTTASNTWTEASSSVIETRRRPNDEARKSIKKGHGVSNDLLIIAYMSQKFEDEIEAK